MSASTLERTARTRRSRTRSRTVNARPALALSTLKPHQYDLRPACASLVCPDCETWVPITGFGTKKPKVVPHDTGRAGKDLAVRCRLGSNRLVTVNVTVRKWQERLEDGHAETGHRRSDRVVRKPQAKPAPAVMQIVGGTVDDKTACKLDEAHVRGCSTCSVRDNEGRILRAVDIASRCTDGRRLAQLAAHTKRLAPARRKAQMDREDWHDRRAWALRLLHEQQWDQHAKKVGDADLQRVDDALAALIQTLNPRKADAPQLTDWERADLMSAITLLATRREQLERHRR
ncbi:hypothetical protein [Streptomyces sp. NPDC056323]|uniref:hypothetical protein n=1 Tax=Streptomyces sp. NPDC056323 TaxID=3345784 RepID=UPI0035E1F113